MARSFVKWVGGKYQLLDEINAVIDSMIDKQDEFIYAEPFVGGGALLFNILENKPNMKMAFINDMNTNLIKCYRTIKDCKTYPVLKETLKKIQKEYNELNSSESKKDYYMKARNAYNKNQFTGELSDTDCAAIFIFLNKTSFNGLYRENSKGEFNVPWNQKETVNLFDEDNLDRCHNLLKKVVIMNEDYSNLDFVMQTGEAMDCKVLYYMDPPYRPLEGTNSFVSYTKSGFGDNDQISLKKFCDRIDSCGCDFILSNSKSGNFFENLYDGYEIDVVGARRNVNSNGEKRGEVDELIIYNKKKKNISVELF